MARALYPSTHISQEQRDLVREAAERAALIEVAKRTGSSVYLRTGRGPDTAPGAADIDSRIVALPEQSEIIARAVLANTDLNLAIVGAFDIWQTGALVANTELQYINHQLDEDESVSLFGASLEDANPSSVRLALWQATSLNLALWDLTPLYSTQEPVGYADEYVIWKGRDTVRILTLPRTTKVAPGDLLCLHGFMAQPRSKVLSR